MRGGRVAVRTIAGAVLIGALVSGAGCSATVWDGSPAATPAASMPTGTEPSATPVAYDVKVTRSFVLSDGSTQTGCLAVAVERDAAAADRKTDEHLAAARALVTGTDWEAEPVSLDELSADELQHQKDRGDTEAVMLAGILSSHISAALTRAGLLGQGVSLRGHVGC